MPDAAGETEKGVLREVDPGGIGRHGLPTAYGGRIEHEAQQRVPRCRAERVLDPWARVDLDEVAGAGVFVAQDFDFGNALVVEQLERLARQCLDLRLWRELHVATYRTDAWQGAALDGDVACQGLAGSGRANRILDERPAEQGFIDLDGYAGSGEAAQQFDGLGAVGDLGRFWQSGGAMAKRRGRPDQQRPRQIGVAAFNAGRIDARRDGKCIAQAEFAESRLLRTGFEGGVLRVQDSAKGGIERRAMPGHEFKPCIAGCDQPRRVRRGEQQQGIEHRGIGRVGREDAGSGMAGAACDVGATIDDYRRQAEAVSIADHRQPGHRAAQDDERIGAVPRRRPRRQGGHGRGWSERASTRPRAACATSIWQATFPQATASGPAARAGWAARTASPRRSRRGAAPQARFHDARSEGG